MHVVKGKNERGRGLRGPYTPRQGMIPWTRNSGSYLMGKTDLVPAVACKRLKSNDRDFLSLSGTVPESLLYFISGATRGGS